MKPTFWWSPCLYISVSERIFMYICKQQCLSLHMRFRAKLRPNPKHIRHYAMKDNPRLWIQCWPLISCSTKTQIAKQLDVSPTAQVMAGNMKMRCPVCVPFVKVCLVINAPQLPISSGIRWIVRRHVTQIIARHWESILYQETVSCGQSHACWAEIPITTLL